eukprot:scaffold23.g4084.t1
MSTGAADPPAPEAAGGGGPAAAHTAAQPLHAEEGGEAGRLTLGGAQAPVIDHGTAGEATAGMLAGEHPALLAGLKRYLCLFLHRFLEFRLPEVEALAGLAGGAPGAPPRLVAARSMLVKLFVELWGEGESEEALLAAVAAYPQELKAPYAAADQSFRFAFECLGFKMDSQARKQHLRFAWLSDFSLETVFVLEQLDLIERFEGPTQFKGPIRMRDPDHRFLVVACQGDLDGLPPVPHRRARGGRGAAAPLTAQGAAGEGSGAGERDRGAGAHVPGRGARFYFGRQVGASERTVIARYALPSRRYLGPTSMDTETSFVMCNQGRVHKGSVVYDPFVGTGSILLSAAHLGAHTLGTDIDMRVIKFGKRDGAGRAVNVWTNFADAGLEVGGAVVSPVGLVRCDLHRPPFRRGAEAWVDAIICDPPYGVRAGGRKSSTRELTVTDRQTHISSTDPYTLGECLRDLVGLAAWLLVPGGRLVFFCPAAEGYYCESELPTHPAMQLVANSEQILTTRYSRRLVQLLALRSLLSTAAQSRLNWAAAAARAMASEAGGLEELRGQSCRGMCRRDAPRVAEADLPRLLALLPAWRLAPDGNAISRSFTARNFMAAMDFLNRVAALAEVEGHHPDLHLTAYRDGLALPDLVLASKIDTLPVDYSPRYLERTLAAGGAAPGVQQHPATRSTAVAAAEAGAALSAPPEWTPESAHALLKWGVRTPAGVPACTPQAAAKAAAGNQVVLRLATNLQSANTMSLKQDVLAGLNVLAACLRDNLHDARTPRPGPLPLSALLGRACGLGRTDVRGRMDVEVAARAAEVAKVWLACLEFRPVPLVGAASGVLHQALKKKDSAKAFMEVVVVAADRLQLQKEGRMPNHALKKAFEGDVATAEQAAKQGQTAAAPTVAAVPEAAAASAAAAPEAAAASAALMRDMKREEQLQEERRTWDARVAALRLKLKTVAQEHGAALLEEAERASGTPHEASAPLTPEAMEVRRCSLKAGLAAGRGMAPAAELEGQRPGTLRRMLGEGVDSLGALVSDPLKNPLARWMEVFGADFARNLQLAVRKSHKGSWLRQRLAWTQEAEWTADGCAALQDARGQEAIRSQLESMSVVELRKLSDALVPHDAVRVRTALMRAEGLDFAYDRRSGPAHGARSGGAGRVVLAQDTAGATFERHWLLGVVAAARDAAMVLGSSAAGDAACVADAAELLGAVQGMSLLLRSGLELLGPAQLDAWELGSSAVETELMRSILCLEREDQELADSLPAHLGGPQRTLLEMPQQEAEAESAEWLCAEYAMPLQDIAKQKEICEAMQATLTPLARGEHKPTAAMAALLAAPPGEQPRSMRQRQ